MKAHLWKKGCLFMTLLPLLWGCGGSVGGIRQDALAYQGQDVAAGDGTVPVSVVLGNGGGGAARTIAPEHIDQTALGDPGQYTLELTGTSDMGGSVSVPNFALRDGRGILALTPGAWTLRLTATPVPLGGTTADPILSGSTLLIVQDSPTTASITLTPLTGTGTVKVDFTIPESVVKRLDPTTTNGNQKQVAVALYNTTGQEVANTRQTFPVTTGTAPATIGYTANNNQVPSGRYTLRLTAPYTVNNASTGNQSVIYNLGWSDILYVENGRASATTVAIPEARSSLGVPGTPHRRDKVNQTVTVARSATTTGTSASNIAGGTSAQTFTPHGEGLWIYGANWDGGTKKHNQGAGGNRGNTIGNEVLLVTWNPVYDADYYELEMLLHANFGQYNETAELVLNNVKYATLPATDADWATYKNMNTLKLRWSGGAGDSDYYKTKFHTHMIRMNSATPQSFDFVAWRDLANGRNNNFQAATAAAADGVAAFIGPPDTSTGLSKWGTNASYRIGLEGDCDALAVLVNSFSPQHWYGIRLRGVNRFGYSDWVYWKGGKN